jgi:ribosome-binding protein aMBF1 (putative translation factor)
MKMTTETMTTERSYLDEELADKKGWMVFEQERLAYQFGELIDDALESQKISQAMLAEKLGKSPSVISRVLNAGSNLTLRTMVELSAAVGIQIVDFETRAIPSISSPRGDRLL